MTWFKKLKINYRKRKLKNRIGKLYMLTDPILIVICTVILLSALILIF
jgi:hypothetical protein